MQNSGHFGVQLVLHPETKFECLTFIHYLVHLGFRFAQTCQLITLLKYIFFFVPKIGPFLTSIMKWRLWLLKEGEVLPLSLAFFCECLNWDLIFSCVLRGGWRLVWLKRRPISIHGRILIYIPNKHTKFFQRYIDHGPFRLKGQIQPCFLDCTTLQIDRKSWSLVVNDILVWHALGLLRLIIGHHWIIKRQKFSSPAKF